jgi:Skp family chaperone for outer membrane proteins
MSSDAKSKQMAQEYGIKAKEFMDRVTDDQNPEIKERVDKVQKAVEKTTDKSKDVVS